MFSTRTLEHLSTRTLIVFLALFFSCSKPTSGISQSEIDYLKKLGLLDDNEVPIVFDTQTDYESGGNFISDKRLAAYLVGKSDTSINSARYEDIDSLVTKDMVHSVEYASYVRVFPHNAPPFQVYVDGDSSKVHTFFNEAMSRWKKVKSTH